MILEAVDVYRFYRSGEEETLALRGVSLDVAPGEMVAIVGPSGSGKSTLLACLAGLDDPDGGIIRVAGQRISHQPEPVKAARRAELIGVLSQSGNLIEHLTVAQNVDLAQRLVKRRDPDWRDGILKRMGLAGRAGAWPSRLSGGEAARAALAVALANKPALLLADEPTGELDEHTETPVLELIRDQAAGDTAVVVASHSLAVRRLADRTVTLRDGRVT
ncbi:putative ABC transport system ATP-binding protein [Streptosporangium album]|uniref:Putative ABC transport system ATP-binding protein n=1 Tax=Streptosporangium album TaxID=47479 RepID=A0A7W7WDL2_9ACTN|nr:ATP-binding cassette domain-containing protein [Streptosporangium album]MBB4943231.1 putative ABC transport system ATP-binding protein [Streptosporangium album]